MSKRIHKKKKPQISVKDFHNKPVCEISENVFVPDNLVLEMNEQPKYKEDFYEELKKANLKTSYQKFKPFYKEKRVYKPRPVYESFDSFPEDLHPVFQLAIETFEPDVSWITLKRFLNDKTHPRKRWLWGFSLRHRGTEKIRINNNDLLVLLEWKNRTGGTARIEVEKLFDESKAYMTILNSLLASSKVYGNGKVVQWMKELYLKEIERASNEVTD